MPASRETDTPSATGNNTKKFIKSPAAKKSPGITDLHFKAIFENAGIGIVFLDLERKIVSSNPAFQRFLKYSEDELTLLTLSEITHPDDCKLDEKLFKEVLSGKRREYTIEKKYLTKDRCIVHGRTTISSSFNSKDKTTSILAIVEDIAMQKQLEKNFLDALLENSLDQIYFKDLKSRFIKVSNTLARRHNMQVDDLIGKTDFDVFGMAHASEAFNDEQEIIRTGKPIIGKEEQEDWIDGKITWVSTSKMPFYNEEGKIIGTFGISRDITQKKQTEHSQKAIFKISETAFTSPDMDSLYKKIHDVIGMLLPAKNLHIALYDEKKNILTFPYYADENNQPRETTKPRNGLIEYVLLSGEAALVDNKKLNQLVEAGKVEVIGIPPKIWLGVPLKLSGKTIGIIAVQDYENPGCYGESEMKLFTFVAEQIAQAIERKKNAVEIQRYTEELKQLNATKDKFFSIIAHDLKNPFITIMGFSDLLCADYNELTDEERLFYIREMKKSADLSHSLLQNLLQWSRSQTGRIEFNPRKLEVAQIVDEIFDLLKVAAAKKQIKLQNKVLHSLQVTADEEMINTVFRNLITNAIKFSNRDGIVSVSAKEEEEFAEICVSDNGIGMDKNTIDNLFKLEATHSQPGTENETGTGLGIILCKEFIEKHGGTIGVESETGQGSKFYFTLPLRK
ncbi:MAG: PAS domain S-box protein [Ignavibacteria bacterium]|jgi:PAS domain S-box-containing protein